MLHAAIVGPLQVAGADCHGPDVGPVAAQVLQLSALGEADDVATLPGGTPEGTDRLAGELTCRTTGQRSDVARRRRQIP